MFAHLPHELERLRLRRLRPDDLGAFHAYRGDPIVARYQGWRPMSLPEAADFLRLEAAHADTAPGSWRQFGVAERATDRLVGDMGLWLAADGLQAEFGLSIHPAVQGQGYGTECVRGLLALVFATTAVCEIVATTDVRNAPCLALLARTGMRELATRRGEYKGEPCLEKVFAIGRAEAAVVPDGVYADSDADG